MCKKEYAEWYLSTHSKPVDIREATRYWLNRPTQLYRRQHPAPGSYEEILQNKAGNGKTMRTDATITSPHQETRGTRDRCTA